LPKPTASFIGLWVADLTITQASVNWDFEKAVN